MNLFCKYTCSIFQSVLIKDISLYLSFYVASSSEFGLRITLAKQNEFGSVPSSILITDALLLFFLRIRYLWLFSLTESQTAQSTIFPGSLCLKSHTFVGIIGLSSHSLPCNRGQTFDDHIIYSPVFTSSCGLLVAVLSRGMRQWNPKAQIGFVMTWNAVIAWLTFRDFLAILY